MLKGVLQYFATRPSFSNDPFCKNTCPSILEFTRKHKETEMLLIWAVTQHFMLKIPMLFVDYQFV